MKRSFLRVEGFPAAMLVMLLALVFTAPALAGNSSWVLVTRKSGVVESNLSKSSSWLRIINNRRLGDYDSVRTAADGAARLQLSDNSLLAMGPNTQAKMREFVLSGQRRSVDINVSQGFVQTRVSKYKGRNNRFQISTPNSTMAAQGTEFFVSVIIRKLDSNTIEPPAEGLQSVEITTSLQVTEGVVNILDATGKYVLAPVSAGNKALIQSPSFVDYNSDGSINRVVNKPVRVLVGDQLSVLDSGLAETSPSEPTEMKPSLDLYFESPKPFLQLEPSVEVLQSPVSGAIYGDIQSNIPLLTAPTFTSASVADVCEGAPTVEVLQTTTSSTGSVIIDIGNYLP